MEVASGHTRASPWALAARGVQEYLGSGRSCSAIRNFDRTHRRHFVLGGPIAARPVPRRARRNQRTGAVSRMVLRHSSRATQMPCLAQQGAPGLREGCYVAGDDPLRLACYLQLAARFVDQGVEIAPSDRREIDDRTCWACFELKRLLKNSLADSAVRSFSHSQVRLQSGRCTKHRAECVRQANGKAGAQPLKRRQSVHADRIGDKKEHDRPTRPTGKGKGRGAAGTKGKERGNPLDP